MSTQLAQQNASIVTSLDSVFPEITTDVPFTPGRSVRRNWKAFFNALPVGGSFLVADEKESATYYQNGRRYKALLRRKKQPGGAIRLWRVAA